MGTSGVEIVGVVHSREVLPCVVDTVATTRECHERANTVHSRRDTGLEGPLPLSLVSCVHQPRLLTTTSTGVSRQDCFRVRLPPSQRQWVDQATPLADTVWLLRCYRHHTPTLGPECRMTCSQLRVLTTLCSVVPTMCRDIECFPSLLHTGSSR